MEYKEKKKKKKKEENMMTKEKREERAKLKFPLAAVGKLNHNYKLILSRGRHRRGIKKVAPAYPRGRQVEEFELRLRICMRDREK